ncbi:hypothetical protein [Allosphingosinicella sp.]|jgi:plastocyanin|uniref:hypothetical protein n=1 Tax=Allosphingosinicella sp. TaxID=2823234 RepID=UPI002F02EC2E
MRRLPLLFAAALLAAPSAVTAHASAAAQEPEWRQSAEYDVLLKPYAFEPEILRLEAGRPVRLRFVNSGQTSLSFSAEGFFRAARVRSGDDEEVEDGSIRLRPGERKTIVLVPAAGRYRMRSSNLLHRLLGMSGRIIVE